MGFEGLLIGQGHIPVSVDRIPLIVYRTVVARFRPIECDLIVILYVFRGRHQIVLNADTGQQDGGLIVCSYTAIGNHRDNDS